MRDYEFLAGMYRDGYFPNFLVGQVREVLVRLCQDIETTRPTTPDGVYALTHAATEVINVIAESFDEHESEFETVAREVTAADFRFIVEAYGFNGLDTEELIAPRDW